MIMTLSAFMKILNDAVRKAVKAVNAKGLTGFVLMIAVAIAVTAAIAWVKKTYEPLVIPEPPPVAATQAPPQEIPVLVIKIDKTVPDWQKKYCHEEVAKLPPAPFRYDNVEGPSYQLPSTYMMKFIPEEKRYSNAYACGVEYKYDNEEEAFASLGVAYKFDIERFNDFYQQIDHRYASAISKEWKKLSPFDRKETGVPYPGYEGLPGIFKRESERADTVEFAEAIRLPQALFVKFTFYEK